MKYWKLNTIIIAAFFISLIISCVEPFEPNNLSYENLLVIDGKVTNEEKHHVINLSRTYKIDTLLTNPEKNALVYIIDDTQQSYNFTEIEDGSYQSDVVFSAVPNKTYTLKVTTQEGKKYTSTAEKLTEVSEIEGITINVTTNNLAEEVVSLDINSYAVTNNARYYLYEYEETYKIIAPYWNNLELKVNENFPSQISQVQKTIQNKTCYKTQNSTTIIQTETSSLSEDSVVNFPIRSIITSDFILSHRYSILVKQYVQTFNAYNYYQTLQKFSNSEGVFSENQVGFIKGNLRLETNENENIIGFFEVSSVASKRIFFNKEAITDVIPNFIDDCSTISPLLFDSFTGAYPLANEIKKDTYIYFEDNVGSEGGPYTLVKKICGDCTVLGSNIKPDFWID